MDRSIRNVYECRYLRFNIIEGMYLYASLFLPELCPLENRKAKSIPYLENETAVKHEENLYEIIEVYNLPKAEAEI